MANRKKRSKNTKEIKFLGVNEDGITIIIVVVVFGFLALCGLNDILK